jgi:signal transduction histidine kinase
LTFVLTIEAALIASELRSACGVSKLVADTGNGIDPAHRDPLFDPFFTTKAVGSGTGLGLFITRQIVREHLGTIDVETELGKGTTFVINLPVPSA